MIVITLVVQRASTRRRHAPSMVRLSSFHRAHGPVLEPYHDCWGRLVDALIYSRSTKLAVQLLLGTLVAYIPGADFAEDALRHLDETCEMFAEAKYSLQAPNCLVRPLSLFYSICDEHFTSLHCASPNARPAMPSAS